jgi:hypothetical protein
MQAISFQSDDINALYLFCSRCDFEWRAHAPERCTRCGRTVGIPFVLEPPLAEDLMRIVDESTFGANDEEDEEHMMSLLETHCPWFNKDDAWYSQACYMYLRALPRTPENQEALDHVMEYFEMRFLDAVPYMQIPDDRFA